MVLAQDGFSFGRSKMQNEDIELLTIAELAKLLRRCRTSIRADVKAGRLPAPIALGPRHRGWLRCDVMTSLEGARCRVRPSIEGEEV
jgi:predicted DNA-binding transcriptional regulator AlpA